MIELIGERSGAARPLLKWDIQDPAYRTQAITRMRTGQPERVMTRGFTLIEMSIVLVIIGLIVGGILLGRDLIAAAGVRAQISQIERYQQAVNTFRGKYGSLPGDIPNPDAVNFGFVSRGSLPGQGDGNGVLQGNNGNGTMTVSGALQGGEPTLFWEDLSMANLIEGGFNTATPTNMPAMTTATSYNAWWPQSKIGAGAAYVVVWSGGWSTVSAAPPSANNYNYFGIVNIQSVNVYGGLYGGGIVNTLPLTVAQAYAIDSKLDDGLPQTGNVMALQINYAYSFWGTNKHTNGVQAPWTAADAGDATTCFDNGGVVGVQQYSISQNNGIGVNCPIAIKMQ